MQQYTNFCEMGIKMITKWLLYLLLIAKREVIGLEMIAVFLLQKQVIHKALWFAKYILEKKNNLWFISDSMCVLQVIGAKRVILHLNILHLVQSRATKI